MYFRKGGDGMLTREPILSVRDLELQFTLRGKVMTSAPLRYQLFLPVCILAVITISFYVVGNSFADAADPKNHVR